MAISTCLCVSTGEANLLPGFPGISDTMEPVPFSGKGSITLAATPTEGVYSVLNHAQNGSFDALGFQFVWALKPNPAIPSQVTWSAPGPSVETLKFSVIIDFTLSVAGSVGFGACTKNTSPAIFASNNSVSDPLNPPPGTTFTLQSDVTFNDCGTGLIPFFRIPRGFTIAIPMLA